MLATFRAESSTGSWHGLGLGGRRMVDCAGLIGCLTILAAGLSACSSKSGSPTPVLVSDASPDKPADASVRVTITGEDCPTVTVTAGPAIARVGGRVAVSAIGADDDGADRLTYGWSAAAGSFTSPTNPTTAYTCPSASQAGPQILTVAVSDGKCSVTRSITVSCDLLVLVADASADSIDANDGGADASTGGAGGAGGSGGTGSGGILGGTGGAGGACTGSYPSDCEGIACNQCTFGVGPGETDVCSSNQANCFNCDPTTMGCQLMVGDADRIKCNALYTCIRDSQCTTAGPSTTHCFCGDIDDTRCFSSSFTGARNGACMQQIIAAAGTSNPETINTNFVNPTVPLGAAMNLALCRATYCGKHTDPPNPTPPCSAW